MRDVYLPSVAAWVLGNLKVAVGFAFTGAVVGEFVAATRGLGYLLSFAQSTYNAALMFALVLLIMVGGAADLRDLGMAREAADKVAGIGRTFVIASAAKQSNASQRQTGLLRCARNDDGERAE